MAEVIREVHEHHSDHLVQVYSDHMELAESVATFLASGFEAGEPAVLVVAAAHLPSIRERLGKHGWPVEQAEAQGLLIVRDAETTLEALYDGSTLSPRRFREVVGVLLDEAEAAAPGHGVNAFGEMVDVLVHRGDREAADLLEGYWNDLLAQRAFTLLCAYRVDLFDPAEQVTLLPQVYRAHTHVLSTADAERLDAAVRHALDQVLGDDADTVYAHAARHERAETAPVAQLALLWISAHMPRTAEQVLAAAREHYAAAA